ncbi:MAG: NfeD family protein [Planctomycetaceae bacterium]|nr:NfeD family protein [Planctomycetaceae bacterium]
MLTWIDNLRGLELLFACCAIFGTTLFVIRLVLMFMGMGDSHAGEAAGMEAGPADMGNAGTVEHAGDFHESDLSFKALSLQGITAFFMMFGLIGWATIRQYPDSVWVPVAAGTAAGLATVWLMKKIFQIAGALQSSGTMNLSNAVGQEGSVYLTIRPGASGKVQVRFQNRLSILDAVSESDTEIKTGETVRVVRIAAGKLVVEKIIA